MKPQYHILNGDALKEQFPQQIEGEVIVMRECLVEGDIQANTLDEFFQVRAKYLGETFPNTPESDYFEKVAPEFLKMQAIPSDSAVNLWFEDDLFCQTNFWFVVHLLSQKVKKLHLVRPKKHTQYGFAAYDGKGLEALLEAKVILQETILINQLWLAYQADNLQTMSTTAEKLQSKYPFILEAVQAHLDRQPNEQGWGRPHQTLANIIEELGTDSFGKVFKEFNRRAYIYGFGDLQVKKIYDEVIG